jgi:hypothetical protein
MRPCHRPPPPATAVCVFCACGACRSIHTSLACAMMCGGRRSFTLVMMYELLY